MNREVMEQEMDKIRSKYGEKILKKLWENRMMYHGDLATQLSLSPSGLNAIIKKMEQVTPSLVHIEQVGKFKKYSLSDEMQEYMDHAYSSQPERGEQLESETPGLFIPIQRFVEGAGAGWREVFNLLLCGEDAGTSQEIQNDFDCLIRQLEQLYKNNRQGLLQLQHFIGNEVLIYLMDEYFKGGEG